MFKKLISCILSAAMLLGSVSALAAEDTTNIYKTIYVGQNTGTADGTKANPFPSIEAAKEYVRTINQNMTGDIVVQILPGYYELDSFLDFTNEDSGKNGHRIIYKGDKDNMPVISGGRKLGKMTQSKKYPALLEAKVEDVEQIRELYVNGERRYRAASEYVIVPQGGWDDPNTSYDNDGLYFLKEDFGVYENPKDIELMWYMGWSTYFNLVDEIEEDPDSTDKIRVRMERGTWDWVQKQNLNSNDPKPTKDKSVMVYNAFELLDNPGEFYYNKKTQMLYYMPKEGETADNIDVIVPVQEKLMMFMGNDIDDKITNVEFRYLQMGYTTWYAFGHGSSYGRQAQYWEYTNDLNEMPAAITLNRCSNVNFSGNYFVGIASVGIWHRTGVNNCSVIGNAFSDIGDAAYVCGISYTQNDNFTNQDRKGTSDAPPADKTQLNLIDRYVKVAASSMPYPNGIETLLGTNEYKTWVDAYTYYPNSAHVNATNTLARGTWISDTDKANLGEKAWVRYDFDRAYTIDEIALTFDKSALTNAQCSGFEVLLSNDKFFSEGNYHTVAVQNGPADSISVYKNDSDEKYRFLMIRTTGATVLGLSQAYALTSDMKPYTMHQRNKYNTFSNNYVLRTSNNTFKGAAVNLYYTDDTVVSHNEIDGNPYSGIMFGWGWNYNRYGTYDNVVEYNKITDVTKLLHDGAGIYTLGVMPGSQLRGNYIEGTNFANGALYFDQGTSSLTATDNVVVDSARPLFIAKNDHNDKITGLHAENDEVRTHDTMVNITIGDIDVFSPGTLSPEAYEIKQNAGLEPEYEWLRDIVVDGEMQLPDLWGMYYPVKDYKSFAWDVFNTVLAEIVEDTLTNGNFGNEIGQLPYDYYYSLRKAYDKYLAAQIQSRKYYDYWNLRETLRSAYDRVNRLSFEDTLEFLNKVDSEALAIKDNCECLRDLTYELTVQRRVYLTSGYEPFKTRLDEINAVDTSALSEAEKYAYVLEMEQMYNTLESGRVCNMIDYVYADDMKSMSIDNSSRTVQLTFPYGTDLSSVDLEISSLGRAEIYGNNKGIDLTKVHKVPVYNDDAATYVFYEVHASVEAASNNYQLGGSDWVSTTSEYAPFKNNSGATVLKPNNNPYVTTAFDTSKNGASLRFTADSSVDDPTFKLFFGIQSPDDFRLDDSSAKYNHVEVLFEGGYANLYTSIAGTRTKIASAKLNLTYGATNNLAYSFEKSGTQSAFKLVINGETVFNNLVDFVPGNCYMGCYSERVSIKIN